MRKMMFTEKFDHDVLPGIAPLAKIHVAITSSL
jgi:hypothetical protein